jgi:DNA repair protein RadC
MVHNHPSGKLTPSDSDKTITKKLKESCDLLDILLLDHLIISKDGYYSFADEGKL